MTPRIHGWLIVLAFLVTAAVLIGQQRSLHALRTEHSALRAEVDQKGDGTSAQPETASRSARPPVSDDPLLAFDQRIARLEDAATQMGSAMDHLMERGEIPLSQSKKAELRRRFLDGSLPDEERLHALRLLRNNHRLDEPILAGALAWMNSSTNGDLIAAVLIQLGGVTNAIMRAPLIEFATLHADPDVRQQAVVRLGAMVGDSGVEEILWKILTNDASDSVRDQASAVLRQRPMTDSRLEDLQRRVLDANTSFQERLTAFQSMSNAKATDANTTANFAEEIVNRGNAEDMKVLFQALDNTGNLAAAPALVKGLQMEEPELRAMAADALSEMQSDPIVRQWLRFTAESDPDPNVRSEAARVLDQFKGEKP